MSSAFGPKKSERRVVPQAFPYQGSKRALARAILPLLPEGTTVIVEPFAGSAAVSVAALYSGAAGKAVLGDVNAPLIALWQRILTSPVQLAEAYRRLWQTQLADPRAFYLQVRERFNATRQPELLLYLLNRCVKAAVRYSRDGDFNQAADHRRLGARPERVRTRILSTSRILTEVTAVAGDYAPLLLGTAPDGVCYLDPPYQGVTNTRDQRYLAGLDRSDFEQVLHQAVAREVSFIVSYDMVSDEPGYGPALDASLGLVHLHLAAGRSSQATLSGRRRDTVESLYLSPALVERLRRRPASDPDRRIAADSIRRGTSRYQLQARQDAARDF